MNRAEFLELMVRRCVASVLLAATLVMSFSACAARSAHAVPYHIVEELGTLSLGYSYVPDVKEPGQVVEFPYTSDTRPTEPPTVALAPESDTASPKEQALPGRLIVKFEEGADPAAKRDVRADEGLEKQEELDLIDAEVAKIEGQPVEEAVRHLERRPEVEYAEEDFIVYPSGFADEPRHGELWGLHNTGQWLKGWWGEYTPSVLDMDVNAPEAHAATGGAPSLVVAVVDDGVDLSHPDLAERAWVNPGESGNSKENNNVDDDGNGYVDDVHGWDFYHDDNTVHDPGEDGHGTHVAGTIAASQNGTGVVGVAPNVMVMALKFIGPEGGALSDAISAIEYAKEKGVKISNNSWGCAPGDCYSEALKDAIEASGQLFVAAAGNYSNNNDVTPTYPASYDSPNILSVAATGRQMEGTGFSNYGFSVDIAAPGVDILSATPETPAYPAAALTSVGTSGKALAVGFGVNEIGDGENDVAKQASFMSKALETVGHLDGQEVVLVDDDLSDALNYPEVVRAGYGYPDVGEVVKATMESTTGSALQVIDVPYGSNGPSLAQLSGKTVVWSTGMTITSGSRSDGRQKPPLTHADRRTLTDFLRGGGKLVLTGSHWSYMIERSHFMTDILKLDIGWVEHTAFNGAPGTAFAGESYDLNSPTHQPFQLHWVLIQRNPTAVTQGVYPSQLWQLLSGTSMAAPHATGAAALAASVNPALLDVPTALKKAIMDSGKDGTVVGTATGDMVDAEAAVRAARSETIITSGPIPLDNRSAIYFYFTRPGGPFTFECSLDDALFQQCTPGRAYTNLSDGSHTFRVRAKDDQGRIVDESPAERTWTVDTTSPEPPVITSPAEGGMPIRWAGLSGTAEPGSKVFVFEGEQFRGSARVDRDGAWSAPIGRTSDGTSVYTARTIDAANNWSGFSAPRTVTYDIRAPETAITAAPASLVRSSDARFEFTADEPSAAFKCSVDEEAYIPCESERLYESLADGEHAFRVRATDAAGNTDFTPSYCSWTVDTVGPEVEQVKPAEGGKGLSPSTNVVAIFSEKMDRATLTTATFQLYEVLRNADGTTTTQQVTDDTTVRLSTDGLKAILNPLGTSSALLAPTSRYKAVLTKGVRDPAGNPLLAKKVWYFTTGSS